jgi:hypothetical protein
MAELCVTCPECGLRGELAHSGQDFSDPAGSCKHFLNPATCPSLRIPLICARRLLENLEWDAFLATGEEIRIPAVLVQAPVDADKDAPEVSPTLPLVAEDSQTIGLAPSYQPDAVAGEGQIDQGTMATHGDA